MFWVFKSNLEIIVYTIRIMYHLFKTETLNLVNKHSFPLPSLGPVWMGLFLFLSLYKTAANK